MQPDARDRSISRRRWLLAGVALPLSLARAQEAIQVLYDGEGIRPVAPNLHFLTGKALQRLKDADTVVYVATLKLFTVDQMLPFRERPGRFAVSYDILEEKFKAVITESAERSKAGMTASQAETWCLDSLAISAAGLAPDRPFFLRLEMRAAGPKEEFSNVMADPFRAVVEMLSRKAGPGEQHWGPFESNPRRLSDLVRPTTGQGARSG
jgi:hypothetical protein